MKMIKKFVLIAALFGLVACGSNAIRTQADKEIDWSTLDSNDFSPTKNGGELGSFDLISPFNGVIGESFTEFTWGKSENAKYYMLEVCSSDLFINNNPNIDYYSKSNIIATSFKIHSTFIFKDTTYYWRVFAYNDGENRKLSNTTNSFFIKAQELDEVEFPIGDADDWILHSQGCRADISIDDNNFFNNDKTSVVVTTNTEDNPTGGGYIIVTKTVEKNTYGTDALFFNMYYSGHDADLYVRLIDRDNEYWVAPVQISTNAKQSIIIKFDDFVQRTRDVTVANEKFDHERIKYFEIVYEQFGDGVLLMSSIQAVKFDNYKSFFIDKLDFTEYPENAWVYENYDFETTKTKDALSLKYYGKKDEGKTPINGYGFAKLNVNRFFSKGDSIKMTVKVTGASFTNVILRIYEEDTDRWSYMIPFSKIKLDEEQTFVIPFKAFGKSSITADGKRQFYYILNLQFGLEGAGASNSGTLTFSNFEIVNLKDYRTEEFRAVTVDGLIENFDQYTYNHDIYYLWECTDENKDEYMVLDSAHKFGKNNVYDGQFEYKADMADAKYTLPIKTPDSSFTSFNFLMKDASIKKDDPKFSHLDNVSPDVFISLQLQSGEIYQYIIVGLERAWYQYEISFKDFYLANRGDIQFLPAALTSDMISSISFAFKYYYFDYMGNPSPTYMDGNIVYIDNIYLGHAAETSQVLKEQIIHKDENGVAMVDDFESYESTDDMLDYWSDGRSYDYQQKELSNDVSGRGGNHSGKYKFLSNSDSPAYYIAPSIGSDVDCRGIKLDLKCTVKATIYINFYITIGTSQAQYRATLTSVETSWYEYMIGVSNFSIVGSSSTRPLTKNDLVNINRISIGVVYYAGSGANTQYVYADNIAFDDAITNTTFTRTAL